MVPGSFNIAKRFINGGWPVFAAQSYLFRRGAYKGYHPMSG